MTGVNFDLALGHTHRRKALWRQQPHQTGIADRQVDGSGESVEEPPEPKPIPAISFAELS